jgi:sulfur-oxidizing protein SoxY
MMRNSRTDMIDVAPTRRALVRGAAAAIAFAAWPLAAPLAQEPAQPWQDELKKIMGDAKPVEGKVQLEMPDIAENGNTVPFAVTVESPMTDKDYVKAIHVVATSNPQAGVASFHLSPISGRATVASRMRLARTQDVIAVAELSDGKFLMGKRNVKVTIGGCGG